MSKITYQIVFTYTESVFNNNDDIIFEHLLYAGHICRQFNVLTHIKLNKYVT